MTTETPVTLPRFQDFAPERPGPFRTAQVAGITGLKPRTVQFYTDSGLVVPGVANPGGRGTSRLYSRANLAEFVALRELRGRGLSLPRARIVLDVMRSAGTFTEYVEARVDVRILFGFTFSIEQKGI